VVGKLAKDRELAEELDIVERHSRPLFVRIILTERLIHVVYIQSIQYDAFC
jgi:hypothetical protein